MDYDDGAYASEEFMRECNNVINKRHALMYVHAMNTVVEQNEEAFASGELSVLTLRA